MPDFPYPTPRRTVPTAGATPPCPSWCNPARHPSGYPAHCSAPRVLGAADITGEAPLIALSLYRGDDPGAPYPDDIGDTGIEIEIAGNGAAICADSAGRPVLPGS
ncbi:MAG TPA: hypothetical protein VIY28_14970 [Pseudonocardiaceae bacterium]